MESHHHALALSLLSVWVIGLVVAHPTRELAGTTLFGQLNALVPRVPSGEPANVSPTVPAR